MAFGEAGFASLRRLAAAAAAKAWPKLRLLLVLALAVSMAEFVALDAGLILAADLLLYLEILLGAWTLAFFAGRMPGLATTLMLIPYRLLELALPARRGGAEGGGRQQAPASAAAAVTRRPRAG